MWVNSTVTVLEKLRDPVTDEKKPPWPGDLAVSPIAAVSIMYMGVRGGLHGLRQTTLVVYTRHTHTLGVMQMFSNPFCHIHSCVAVLFY